jgi:hypothetical protein
LPHTRCRRAAPDPDVVMPPPRARAGSSLPTGSRRAGRPRSTAAGPCERGTADGSRTRD